MRVDGGVAAQILYAHTPTLPLCRCAVVPAGFSHGHHQYEYEYEYEYRYEGTWYHHQ